MKSFETRPEPADEDAEALVGLLERKLQSEPPLAEDEQSELRTRLSALYLDKLGDPLAAAVHVEALLLKDSIEDAVLELATALLKCRPIAPRIAEKLSTAYARLGQYDREAGMLSVELDIAKPERLEGVKRRLAVLRHEKLGDAPGAVELLSPLVRQNPEDAELLARFTDAATTADRVDEAITTLSIAQVETSSPLAKARIAHALGTLYTQEGELPNARAAFLSAVEQKLEDEAVLASARRLVALSREPEEPATLGPALDVLLEQEPDAADRHAAAERRLALGALGDDDPAAIPVWRALLDSSRAEEALERLGALYEKTGNRDGFAATLHVRALRTTDEKEARALAVQSARLRTENGGGDAAIEAWKFVVQAFGPARDAHAELIVLLEKAKRWEELSECLVADAALAEPSDAAGVFSKLGEVRLTWLDQREPSLEAFRKALDAENTTGAPAERPANQDPRCRMVIAAIDRLMSKNRPGEALGLALGGLELWPGSSTLSKRVDTLTEGREPPADRFARYERTLEAISDPKERVAHRHAMAELARDGLGNVPEAVAQWKAILADCPGDPRAEAGLFAAYQESGDDDLLPPDFGDRVAALGGPERSGILAGKIRSLVARGEREQAIEACRSLLEIADARETALETVATVAYEENDETVYREALERLANSSDSAVRVQALERLGHYFEQAGNRRAAAESWKPAAMLSAGDPAGDEHARELYERVLAAAPDDTEAAERLLALYVSEGRWANIPGIYAILLRASTVPEATAERLLGLEERALAAGARDDYVGMLDETLPYLGSTNERVRRRLMQSKARVLAKDSARAPEAANAHRALIEAFGSDDAVRAFEQFIQRLEGTARHTERRWLFEWRSSRGQMPLEGLLEWGRAEEEFGDPLGAIRAYDRAAELAPERDEALDALARLRTLQGDFEGALAALRVLRGRAPAGKEQELDVRIAQLVGDDLGRPEEALVALAALLTSSPPSAPALEIARKALERSEELDRTVELIERASIESKDPASAATNLELLLEAPLDEASLGERRESWIIRLSGLRDDDPAESLSVLAKGIAHNPGSANLWEAFIAKARSTKRASDVFDAFTRAIEHPSVGAAEVEALGRRVIAFYDEWSSDSVEVQKTLEAVLERVPGARWALDRVKLLLFGGGRWSELFRIYDRAIEGARDAGERAELLDEAALAARDLARDPDRAIAYLEQLRAVRPNDAPVTSSLERLYERQGESAKLIALLTEREAAATGLAKEELQQRIASLWLDLGDIGSAHALIETMLDGGARPTDVVSLLERVLQVRPEHDVFESPRSPHSRAVALLVEHFQSSGSVSEVIRIREAELGFARDDERRKRVAETLVALHLEAAGEGDEAFIAAIPRVASFGEDDALLSRAAATKLLSAAEEAWTRRGLTPESGAAQAAYWAVRRLEDQALTERQPEEAVRVLLSGARLPFEAHRKRVLARDAAVLLADRAGSVDRAVDLMRTLFAEDPTDGVVVPHVDRFSQWLGSIAAVPERAELWESLGQRAAELGHAEHARGYFTRAADLWETNENRDRAIAASRRSAALGSRSSLEALARLYRERGQWQPAVEALEWAFAGANPEAKAALGSLLADGYLALGERERAAARLEEVLEAVPGATDVRERLAELYRHDERHRPLAELLVKGSEVSTDAAHRLPMLREAAAVFRAKLAEPARAVPLLETAISLDGADPELSLSLADAFDAVGRYSDAARVLRGQLALHGDLRPKVRAPLHHRLAQVLTHLSRSREALAELRAAVEIDASNPEMLYDLARRALEENELELAESTYRALLLTLHRAPPGSGPSRVDVYLDLSEVAARRNEPARAADYIESSFDVSLEGLEEALSLEKALAARGRDDLVARSVERRLRAAKDPGAAAHALGELLRIAEAHPEGIDLTPVIARHATEIGKQVEQSGATDAEVWAILAAAARTGGGERARGGVLSRRIELLVKKAEGATDDEALALLREAAGAWERDLGDNDHALEAYESLLARFPGDWESWEGLFRLSTPLFEPERLEASVEKAIRELDSVSDRSRLRLGLAKLLMADARQSRNATRYLEAVLDEDPTETAAAELLADALEHEGRHAELVTLLEGRLGAVEGTVPVGLSLRLGAALERAGERERAIAVYDAVVKDDSVDVASLDAIRSRLESLSAPSLADCIERILKARSGPDSATLAKRLVVLRDEAGDQRAALRAAAIGFDLDPTDAALRDRLLRNYEARGQIEDACEVLRRAVEACPDDRPLFLSYVDATLRSGDTAGAIVALDRALEAQDSDTELLKERARAKQAAGRDEDALADLEHAFSLDPSFAFEVRTLLERLVQRDLPERDRYVLLLVDVLVEQEERVRAGELLDRFLEKRPEHVGGLERRAGLHAADQQWAAAIAAYERLMPLIGGDHEQFARLSLAFAEACDRAGGAAQARAALERAYAHAPDRADLRERLEAIYEAEGDRARLAELLLSSAGRVEDPARRAAMCFRAAELLLRESDGAERALAAVQAGRTSDPLGLDGSLLYARTLRALERDDEALGELLALAERCRGKPGTSVSRVHFEIARVYLDADYLHEGFDALKLAFQLDPRNVEAAYTLGLVSMDLLDEATASRAMRTVTASRDDTITREKKAMAFYHLARLAQWKGDKRRAQTMAKSALTENPSCDVATALLAALTKQ